ncbi:fimbrial chaperone protein [Izhakiella capsodis]|uniref:Fimbrial chaperone protein n=1 Tax=Izhakiella capsodis TaxID=1367852 RepID=A0A1I4V7D7_9GAMM|nr:fimbria/pilus periplasmic chaperone [Izhakiella capsodis]SFM97065.1 fimbrial chaperone protein [Izhakiella capsodis]
MSTKYLIKAIQLCCLLFISCRCFASADLEIWPVTVSWSTQTTIPTVWLRNVGKDSVSLQVRILKWQQQNNQNIYSDQNTIYSLPTFVNLGPGQELPFRIYGENTNGRNEDAYRIVIDQLPQLNLKPLKLNDSAVDIRMQYVLPFFVYQKGINKNDLPNIDGFPGEKHHIQWSVKGGNLQIQNFSKTHLKIISVALRCGAEICFKKNIPVTYVLSGANVTLPLSVPGPTQKKVTGLIINPAQSGEESFRKE